MGRCADRGALVQPGCRKFHCSAPLTLRPVSSLSSRLLEREFLAGAVVQLGGPRRYRDSLLSGHIGSISIVNRG
jgi:hypothetical protein